MAPLSGPYHHFAYVPSAGFMIRSYVKFSTYSAGRLTRKRIMKRFLGLRTARKAPYPAVAGPTELPFY